MLRRQTKLPESSEAYVWLWQSSYFSDSAIELTSEHQFQFISLFTLNQYIYYYNWKSQLGLPEKKPENKSSVYNSITSLSAMQTPSGFKIRNFPQIRIDNVFIAVLGFTTLEYWAIWWNYWAGRAMKAVELE